MLALFLATLSALPASEGTSMLELSGGLQLDAGSADNAVAYSNAGGWIDGNVLLGMTIFARRVKDDDAAPSLQPFLQRVSRFSLDLTGGGGSSRQVILGAQTPPVSSGRFTLALSGAGYLHWFYLGGGLDLSYTAWHYPANTFTPAQNFSELLATPYLVLGGRWKDLLLFAGWGVTPTRAPDGTETVRFWGNAYFGAHTVIRRFVQLVLRLDVLQGGAVATGSVDVWLRRRFGVSVGLQGGRGAFVNSYAIYDRAGGEVGLSYWLTPRVALSLTYAPLWLRGNVPILGGGGFGGVVEYYSVQHLLTFTARWRPEIRPALPE